MEAPGGPVPPARDGTYIPLSYLTPRDTLNPQGRYRDLDPADDGYNGYEPSQPTPDFPDRAPQYSQYSQHPQHISPDLSKGKYTAVATTIEHHNGSPSPHVPRDVGAWQPWWLRRLVFVVFFGIFASLAALVVLLYVLSQQNNGLADAVPGWTYVWRFGPTAGRCQVGDCRQS